MTGMLERIPRTPTRGAGAVSVAAAIIVNALVQAVLVVVAPALPLTVGGIALAVSSGAVILVAAVAMWWVALSRARVAATHVPVLRLGRLVALIAVTGTVVVIGAVVFPPVVPALVALGCPVVAAGGAPVWALLRRHPARSILLLLATVLAVLLVWVGALLVGLFITGAVASLLTWLVAGLLGAPLIRSWARLAASPPASRS